MTATQSDRSNTVSDLAARLTERALAALGRVGSHRASIDVELQLWHTLEDELAQDRRWQRSRTGNVEAPVEVLRQAVCRATRRVAGSIGLSEESVSGPLCHA